MRLFVILSFLIAGLSLQPEGASAQAMPGTGGQQVPLADPEPQVSEDAEGTAEGDDLEAAPERKTATLDDFFEELGRISDHQQASRVSRRIWQVWNDSGSASINLLMARAETAMKDEKNALALDLLDQVTTLAPGHAEGWNKRATVHYAMREFGLSIADIERTLAIEPRHFGALSGLAMILERLGKDDKALETWYRVLEVYPANKTAQEKVIKLTEELSGDPA